jgi:uncharacterized hydrophobic protein (TIGR00271 family)
MLHMRIVVPQDGTAEVVSALTSRPGVTNIVLLPGAAIEPVGDLVLADVAREAANEVIEVLTELGCTSRGSVAMEAVDTSLSQAADQAEQEAPGSPGDAVVWEEVESRVEEESSLTWSFLTLLVAATLIAACGILLDSTILIVGAMVVGPEFGPLAGVCVAVATRRRAPALSSLRALVVGFPVAIILAYVGTWVVLAIGAAPEGFVAGQRSATTFISHPGPFSVIVAAIAAVAGMVSLTSAKSSALIGVLISVTTVPAAANVGVAAADHRYAEALGAGLQLAVNLSTIVLAGTATLLIQRWLTTRPGRRRAAEQAPV